MKRVLTVSDRSFDVVMFMRADGSGEAVIKAPLSTAPVRFQIVAPPDGMQTVIMHNADGSTEVWYKYVE